MLTAALVFLVNLSRRFARSVAVAALLGTLALGWYVAGNITINTDINQLMSDKLGWRQREKALEVAFPQ
ncbi:MAG: hypothetical protein P4M15_03660, partial [Alphaproteobacteria bacterium]|nr:hypothetical protein [Alphaproteobacteria bacterium]